MRAKRNEKIEKHKGAKYAQNFEEKTKDKWMKYQ